MTDWDKFFKTYDAIVETYTQAEVGKVAEREEHLEKLGYLVKTLRYQSSHGYHYNTFVLRAIRTKKGKRGSKKEKESWVRF